MRPGRGGQAFGRRGRSGQGSERAMAAQERAEERDWRAVRLAKLRGLAHEPAVEGRALTPRALSALSTRSSRAFAPPSYRRLQRTRLALAAPASRMIASSASPLTISSRAPRAAKGKLHCGQRLGEAPFRRAAQGTRAAAGTHRGYRRRAWAASPRRGSPAGRQGGNRHAARRCRRLRSRGGTPRQRPIYLTPLNAALRRPAIRGSRPCRSRPSARGAHA